MSGLAATENPTVPLPVPFAPEVIVMKEGLLLTAAQPQLPADVTLTMPVLPLAEKLCKVGLIE